MSTYHRVCGSRIRRLWHTPLINASSISRSSNTGTFRLFRALNKAFLDKYLTGLEEDGEVCSTIAIDDALRSTVNKSTAREVEKVEQKRLTFAIVLSFAKLV